MMKSKKCLSKTLLYGGDILHRGELVRGKALLFDERIVDLVDLSNRAALPPDIVQIPFEGILSPGLIDIHIHGCAGSDTMDATPEALETIATALLRSGTTSFLATTMTMSAQAIDAALDNARAFRANQQRAREQGLVRGAELLGVHLEGPFINPKFKGAQAEEHIRPPDIAWTERHLDIIRMVTIAPEVEGAMEWIRALSDRCVISLGHSAASYECACEAYRVGARHITHCFNAMTGLHHRNPGLVGAALTQNFSADFIVDGVHIHPDLIGPILRMKEAAKRVLITDAIRATLLEDGVYDLGGQTVRVQEGVAKLDDGTIAGSVLSADQAIRNTVRFGGFSFPEVIAMMSTNPARLLGIPSKGALEIGADADLVVWSRDFQVKQVYIRGVKQ